MSNPEPTDLNETRATLPPADSALTAPLVLSAAGLPSSPVGYEILGELGRGGMGVVYKARQVKLKRLVALKMILAGGHAGAGELARFKAEAEAAARLQHPNIVAVHEVGEHQGCPFFSLEYVEGGSLDRHLAGTPLPSAEAARLTEALARAIHAAHEVGIVHRDLKPANILLAFSDASQKRSSPQRFCEASLNDCVPKIADFGLAKNLSDDSGQTRSGSILGTPSYMAPEQAGGHVHAIGPAADVWALGAILYEMLAGRPPFKGTTATDTILQVIADDPVPPSRLVPRLPRDLETICLKCLQKEPAKRYASAHELAEDLRRFRAGEPIMARPVGTLERGLKWARRRPALATLLVVSVLTAVGFMLLLDQGRREAETRSATERELRDQAVQGRTEAEQRKIEAEQARTQLAGEQAETARLLDLSRRNAFTAQLRRVAGMWQREPEYARDLLEDDNLCPAELRDFSWGFYRRLCDCSRGVLRGHTGRVLALAMTHDGKTLASAGADGLGIVWDLATQKRRVTLSDHRAAVWCVALTPDGTTVASGDRDGIVKVWDVASGKQKVVLKGWHTGSVTGVALTPDGKTLATAAEDGKVRLWNVDSRKVRLTLDGQYLALTPDGKRLVTAGRDGAVKVWDVTSGKERRTLVGPGSSPFAVLGIGRSGSAVLCAGGAAGTVRVWNLESGREVVKLAGPAGARPLCLAFSPDGSWLAVGFDHTLRLWRLRQGGPGRDVAAGHRIHALAFSTDGRSLALAGSDRTVRVWDVATWQQRAVLRGHSHEVTSVAFGPNGKSLLSGSGPLLSGVRGKPGEVLIWDGDSGQDAEEPDEDEEEAP